MGDRGRGAAPSEVSGAITSVVVRYVRSRLGEFGVAQMLAAAGEERPVDALEDPSGWSTHDEVVALLGAARQVTDDPAVGRHCGEELVRQRDGAPPAGSLAALVRSVAEATDELSGIWSVDALEVGEDHAVVRVYTRPSHVRHPMLCDLTKGLFSAAPAIFDRALGVVTETECQAKGGRCCLYCVSWEPLPARPPDTRPERPVHVSKPVTEDRVPARATTALELAEQNLGIDERLEEISTTAADLASGRDLASLLATITERAARVAGPDGRSLLVLHADGAAPGPLHHHGFEEADARALAAELLRPDPDDDSDTLFVVGIGSPRHQHGRLAVARTPGIGFTTRERRILTLYADYASLALELLSTLEESRNANGTTRALLDFTRALSKVVTTDGVAQALADAIPAVARCERSSVLLWDPISQAFTVQTWSNRPRGDATDPPFTLGGDDQAVARALGISRDVLVLDGGPADKTLRQLHRRSASVYLVLVPLVADDELVGVVTAEYTEPAHGRVGRDPVLHDRLRGMADQAVTALQNAWLLDQMGPLAWHDALTGLPNRRLLEDRAHRELRRASKDDEPPTIFFIDLDRFKRVNDTLGHAAGDELIRQVARRLRDVVRNEDTVARLGGDEFAVLLPGISDMAAVHELVARMLETLRRPYVIDGREVHTTASIGIAVYPEHGDVFDELLSHADEAMYRSKSMGRNTFNVFAADIEDVGLDALGLDADLHHAVERNELFVLYQPYIDLQTSRVLGVEALVRWRHPRRGVLEPDAFIRRAEESEVILGIDEFVVRQVAHQVREWTDAGLSPMRVSINVSRRDLLHPGFVGTVLSALEESGVPPELLEIEVPDGIEADDAGALQRTMAVLREKGVGFCIDDFGTGPTSLQQLAAFPARTLKIDRSLVQMVGPSEELGALTTAIIAAAERLGLDCVAEGVESAHQGRVLLQRGCNAAQGYFFSPPLPPADIQRLLAGEAGRPAGAALGDHRAGAGAG